MADPTLSMLHHSDCVMLWHQRKHSSVKLLLHSPSLEAITLSVGYETWPPIGWHHPFVIVWSKYRLGLPSASLHYGLTWPVGIPTVFQTPVTVPLHCPNGRQLPTVRAVQWDGERVYSSVEKVGLWIYFFIITKHGTYVIKFVKSYNWTNLPVPAWKMASGMTIMRKPVIG